uniref:ASCH domain-containing protein n=1 Tax=viral metagenome TaxID=1070528 RepID=A0A6M3LT89_9ZZZZ
MTKRPILFNSKMVSAILEGHKTQTRRVIKPQPDFSGVIYPSLLKWRRFRSKWGAFPQNASKGSIPIFAYNCPFGKVGDKLYVREKFQLSKGDFASTLEEELNKKPQVLYYASDSPRYRDKDKWRPSIHMPKWASRITLEITDIRVERLQDIGYTEMKKEGCLPVNCCGGMTETLLEEYWIPLWNSVAKKEYQWNQNPWVFVISFKKAVSEVKR